MPPASRITDMHTCPMFNGPVPHVGGPILPPCCPTVMIGGIPAARVGDMCVCAGPPDTIIKGSATVFIGGSPAARIGDNTVHGGVIVTGFPTVIIGDGAGSGGGGGAAAGGGGGPATAANAPAPDSSKQPAKAGEKGASQSPEFKSGLGDKIDDLISKSSTLTSNLQNLKDKKWTISYGEAGKGTFANRNTKQIVVDPNQKNDPDKVVQAIAHESGHAMYTPDPVPAAGLTKDEYVKKNVNSSLKDEGEATMTNAQIRSEILKNKGPDIGVAGAQPTKYREVADKYPKPEDRDKARQEIADLFAEGEHPSTAPEKTYKDYYGDWYGQQYDKNNPPEKK